MAAVLEAAGLSKGTGHAALASQAGGKPAWDRRTRQPALSRHQSAFAAGEGTAGRSTLHPQVSAVAPETTNNSFARQHSSLAGSLPHDYHHAHARSHLARPRASLQPGKSSAAGDAAGHPHETGSKLTSQASQSHALAAGFDHAPTDGALQRHRSQAASGQHHYLRAPEHGQMRAGQPNGDLRRPSVVQKLRLNAASPLASKPGGSARSSGSFLSAQTSGNAALRMQGSPDTSPTMLDLLRPSITNGDVGIS